MEELYKYNHPDFPNFTYNKKAILKEILIAVRTLEVLKEKYRTISLEQKNKIINDMLAREIIATAKIEGQYLNETDIQDSIRNNIVSTDNIQDNEEVNAKVLLDAVTGATCMTRERLFKWHRLYFPNGNSEDPTMPIGAYSDVRMEIRTSSGKVIYLAPPVDTINTHMNKFLAWLNDETGTHPFVKAGIAHLWFELIHPFADGNGRIGRSIIDYILKNELASSVKTVAISNYIVNFKNKYYSALGQNSKGHMDVTEYLIWFIQTIDSALKLSITYLDGNIQKDEFWRQNAQMQFNKRQLKVLKKLLHPDFTAVITKNRWSRMTSCSFEIASQDIDDLLRKGVLRSSKNSQKKFILHENI
ncbi:Fic family protein [Aureibacter tunicatorum]|uniref:Fic family protein n=1 Tax=Aureibacter tunicatorum TaxID=866807 RepID=A0AAE4BVQ8_9BACT|nr:DUF4172 domain-containing protein [Aureibacter tunicatorum]MDR6241933.1 Fic family protein [Aureibacter tunicatorum]BDD07540.1 cell division protein Fic [Aureibacter tunicatorum]